ncbi:MAG TPA: hypothetical protein PLN06_06165 [Bacteroidales bacterium]|nr:hypothetical protein [Bacteroidales bacterium]HOU96197.1 hypothetical protein [Bacteroidales bacterium]HQG36051.1 hypothetical protein [Bacteroidales bacterium]HQG52813.1 hypothetical protein [Bacteroidales bacterium]HQJ20830.1 hypothetical protein [Bacteroidales bacterium]
MQIPQTNTVIEFEFVDNLFLLFGCALKEFQSKNNAKVQFLNIPQNIPPDAPRIIVTSRNTIINISLTRIEIISKIPNHIVEDIPTTFLFTKKNINEILSQLWIPELNYKWLGIVVALEFPKNKSDETALQLAIPVFDKLLNIDRKSRELGSFEVKFGFKEGNYFKNYKISCFETRDIKIDQTKLSSIQKVIDLEEISAITNVGLRVIFDVNNKKSESIKTINFDFDEIIEVAKYSIMNITSELNFIDLL